MLRFRCPICEKPIMLTVEGRFRQHGHPARRCKGSGELARAGGLNGEEIANAFDRVARGVSEVITVESVRSGQPRPYADHETVDQVTVRTFGFDGKRHEPVRDLAEYETFVAFDGQPRHPGARTPDEYRAQHFEALTKVALRVLGAEGLPMESEKGHSMEEYFQSSIRSIEQVGPYTVEVTVVYPFTD